MRIKMLVSQAGPHISRRPNQVYDLPDVEEARRLVESGQAEAVDELPPPPEVAEEPEAAAETDEEPETVEPSAEEKAAETPAEPEPKPRQSAARRNNRGWTVAIVQSLSAQLGPTVEL